MGETLTGGGPQLRSYVFSLLKTKNKEAIDPLNLDEWTFYVVPTRWLNRRRRSRSEITLASLQSAYAEVDFDRLRAAVVQVARHVGVDGS